MKNAPESYVWGQYRLRISSQQVVETPHRAVVRLQHHVDYIKWGWEPVNSEVCDGKLYLYPNKSASQTPSQREFSEVVCIFSCVAPMSKPLQKYHSNKSITLFVWSQIDSEVSYGLRYLAGPIEGLWRPIERPGTTCDAWCYISHQNPIRYRCLWPWKSLTRNKNYLNSKVSQTQSRRVAEN